jgi:spore protease
MMPPTPLKFKKSDMNKYKRTDLAMEAREIWNEANGAKGDPDGIKSSEYDRAGIPVQAVDILTDEGSEKLQKPKGRYVTIGIDDLLARKENAFENAVQAIADELTALLPKSEDSLALVVGLGNRDITPDAVGPHAAEQIIATRHLLQRMPDSFAGMRPVTALAPGVLGTTGIETGELVAGVSEKVRPAFLIAIDALASRQTNRLCRTVQLANTGVIPGSGVGNARFALTQETLGIPCLAIGVPTVVDAATLAADLLEQTGHKVNYDALREKHGHTFVTLKEIDQNVSDCAKVIAYGINLALQPNLTIGDIEMFLS